MMQEQSAQKPTLGINAEVPQQPESKRCLPVFYIKTEIANFPLALEFRTKANQPCSLVVLVQGGPK